MFSDRNITGGLQVNSSLTSIDDSKRFMSEEEKQASAFIPPPISFANLVLPPPKEFANNDNTATVTERQSTKSVNRSEKPPVPSKPLFLVNRNMNNNTLTESSWNGNMTGTTKLRNLMLLREPKKKPSVRQAFADDDSSDSFSDTDDSFSDEEEGEKEEIPNEPDASSARAISTSSASSTELINEENSDQYVVAKISIPEQKISKCMQLKITESVWTAKQRIIQSLSKKLRDPLNYGLYHEKLGTFLLDHYPISEYIESGSVGDLQMRYKYRTMENDQLNSKLGKQYAKMKSASKQRDFLLYVQQCATEKMYSLIRKGIDPNFQCATTGETPLTTLCKETTATEPVPVFMALLGGGAHLDFRSKKGLAPMHVATRYDNTQMIRTLLEFKASPNVLDGRDLTPLYNGILYGSSSETARILLDHKSIVGCVDSQGWSEIHQACRYGRLHLLEILLKCDRVNSDMINARNASGNTPLHVCALYNQEACALALLMHGADTTIKNYSNQDAVQVAHVASSGNIAQQIIDFPNHKERAEFALLKARADYVPNKVPLTPHLHDVGSKRASKKHNRSTWTPGSLKKHTKQYILSQKQQGTVGRNSGFLDAYIAQSTPLENRFDSTLPPNAKMPDVKHPKSAENGSEGEHKAQIVVRNYDAQNSDELTLRVGKRVIVLNARTAPPGYDDGMIDDRRGFFPKDCVEEVQLRRRPHPDTGQQTADNDKGKGVRKSRNSLKKDRASVDAAFLQRNTVPDSASVVSFESYEDNHSSSVGRPSSIRSDEMAHYQPTSTQGIYHHTKNVAVSKGNTGFGFILRGAKAEGQIRDFKPTPKYPGLQYLESVEDDSNAHKAGLRSGDFIIMIGETDVRKYGHQQMVDTIRACGEPLHIQATTVIRSSRNDDTSSLSSGSSSSISRMHAKGHAKNDSITSALDHLDNVIAAEESDGSEKTASVRRVPGRKVGGDQLQNLFRPNGDTSAYQRPQSTHSTFSGSTKKPLRVLPPTVSITNNFQYDNIPDSDARSVRSASSSSSSSSSYTTWGRNCNPPVVPKESRAHSVSGATGERLLAQSGAKSKKVPPPPPKRIDSRLSMTIPEDTVIQSSRVVAPVFKNASQASSARPDPQSDMAAAIALAARSRAERLSQSGEQKSEQQPTHQITPKPVQVSTKHVEETPIKSLSEMSPAFSIALAAKQRILNQQKSPTQSPEVKKQSFIMSPTKSSSSIKNNITNDRHVLPPPPSNLPPPPPSSGYDDVSGLALPPPPSFPPTNPRLTSNDHFDDVLDLPPPPMDLLPSPVSSHTADSKVKSPNLGLLPPPPLPPPADDDDGCVSPSGADNLSNADSGVADVTGDGLNLSHGHRHTHEFTIGDNHSTVSSLSTTSTISSEDSNTDYSSSVGAGEKMWPLKEMRNSAHEEKSSSSVNSAGNMYLDVLKKAKNKQPTSVSSGPTANTTTKNFTVTKMTFGSLASVANSGSEDIKPKATSVFPPAPKEYANNSETKPLFGKAPAPSTNTQRVNFVPKTSPAPAVKVVETTPVVVKETEKNVPKVSAKAAEPASNNSDVTAKKPVGQWTVSDVTNWLKELGLSVYAESFEENAIAGEHLSDLGKDELMELGVKPFGHRLTIERSIKKLIGSS